MKMWLAVLLVAAAVSTSHGQGEWYDGRATHFGIGAVNGQKADPWSIHTGHCQYGYLNKDYCTGWNVAAMSDKDKLYEKFQGTAGCGICVEVKCRDANFEDYFGAKLERVGYCFDKSKSVIVQIVDRCQCNYAGNEYSNKRWCCGDMEHLDLSSYTFAQLAPYSKGVMAISFRQVPCSWASSVNKDDFPEGEIPMSREINTFGTQQPRPCDGAAPLPAAAQMASNRRPGGPAAKCTTSVGEGKQCGGMFRNKKAVPGLRDAAWGGVCCRKGLKCKRFNAGWWSCQ